MAASDIRQASEGIESAVRYLTDALNSAGCTEEEVTARNWRVLRALAAYRDAAVGTEHPWVLEWVPALIDIESGDRTRDKVIQFATWVFAVTDEQRAVAAARSLENPDDPMSPIESAADAVSALFDEDSTWPDLHKYERAGLDLEFTEHSAHTMLAESPSVRPEEIARRLDGSTEGGIGE